MLVDGTTLGDKGSRRQLSFSCSFKTTGVGKEDKNKCIAAEAKPQLSTAVGRQAAHCAGVLKSAGEFQVHRRLDHSYTGVFSGQKVPNY